MMPDREHHNGNQMMPEEFREARLTLGLSIVKMAERLGVHHRTVLRWQDGTQDVPGPVAAAVRMMTKIPHQDTTR